MESAHARPMVEVRASRIIPVFNVEVRLRIVLNVDREAQRLSEYLGGQSVSENSMATAFQCGPRFAMIFRQSHVSDDLIAHEIYHLTNLILHYHGIKLDPDNDEIGALLAQYLHAWVWAEVKKNQPLDSKRKRVKLSK